MSRGIIRMAEGGKVSMPLIDVWMTKEEIADRSEEHTSELQSR